MSTILPTLISTLTSLLLAPILLSLCIILFPFAVLTTYFAFVALFVRAAIVHLQVAAAVVRRSLGLEDDFSSPSSWAPKTNREELEIYQQQWESRRRSMIEVSKLPALDIKFRTRTDETSGQAVGLVIAKEISTSRESLSSDTSPATPPLPLGESRPSSSHSPAIARDYEGVGGWYTYPTNSLPGPEPESASLEWLVTNARLELPDADAASLTRPRTPEENKRASSLSGRSHRSMISLQRRGHERSATAGSIEIGRSDETTSLQSTSSRASSLLERSRSQAHIPETIDLFISGRKIEEGGKNKSMIFFSERGSKLATRFAGLKSLGLKKKGKGEISSPEESAVEHSGSRIRDESREFRSKQRKILSHELGQARSVGGSGPSSVEGVETGDLSIWMRP